MVGHDAVNGHSLETEGGIGRRRREPHSWVLNGVTMDIVLEKMDGRIEVIRVDVTGAGLP